MSRKHSATLHGAEGWHQYTSSFHSHSSREHLITFSGTESIEGFAFFRIPRVNSDPSCTRFSWENCCKLGFLFIMLLFVINCKNYGNWQNYWLQSVTPPPHSKNCPHPRKFSHSLLCLSSVLNILRSHHSHVGSCFCVDEIRCDLLCLYTF